MLNVLILSTMCFHCMHFFRRMLFFFPKDVSSQGSSEDCGQYIIPCISIRINMHHSTHIVSIRIPSIRIPSAYRFNMYSFNTYPGHTYPFNTHPCNTYPFNKYASAGLAMNIPTKQYKTYPCISLHQQE